MYPMLLTLLTAEAFLLGGAVTESLSPAPEVDELLSGNLPSSLAGAQKGNKWHKYISTRTFLHNE